VLLIMKLRVNVDVISAAVIVDLLRYDNFVVCYTESYPQRIT